MPSIPVDLTGIPRWASDVNDFRINNHRGFSGLNTNRSYSPAEAQAMLAQAIANPVPSVAGGIHGVLGGIQAIKKPFMGYKVEDPRIEDQQAAPTRPETRFATSSAYGRVIPISLGRRRVEGNIIASSPLAPSLVGTRTYTVLYDVPIYEDPPAPLAVRLNSGSVSGSYNGEAEVAGADCNSDPCSTRGEEHPASAPGEYYGVVSCGEYGQIETCSSPFDGGVTTVGPYGSADSALSAALPAYNSCTTMGGPWSASLSIWRAAGTGYEQVSCDISSGGV
jgi:hypothetical protein